MTKLVTGRTLKVPSANVSADRYQFLQISEAEPDLGLPTQLGQVFTSDLSGNRYWTRLDTANVTESSGSLYYTNARVFANVSVMSINVFADVNLSNLSEGKALVFDGNVFIPVFVNSEVATVADIAGRVLSLENQTTANVREASSNLYFTNTRVLNAIAGADSINPLNVNVNGNLVIRGSTYGSNVVVNQITANSWVNLYSSNVIENTKLFFTNTRVLVGITTGTVVGNISLTDTITSNTLVTNTAIFGSGFGGSLTGANLLSAAFIQGNSWLGLYTANVVESPTNLYFTNTRARLAVSNSTGVYYNTNTGVFSIGQDVKITSDVQFRDMTLSGNLFILGNVAIIAANTLQINDPLIQVGVQNPGDQWDLGWVGHYLNNGKRHAGLFRDHTDGKFKFFSNTLIEPGNVNYIDTAEPAFRLSTVVVETLEGNVIGTVSTLSNFTTSNLAEGINLYYTNTRVVQAVTPLLTTANTVELTNQYFTNVRTLQAVTPLLTTANVIESGTNLYYTNARVVTAITPLLTTANVLELPGNLYYTNARVFANVSLMSINVFADVDITNVSINSTLIWDGTKFAPGASDTALRSNFANSASLANVSLTSNIANTVLSLSNFTTANLVEGTNLYFTNTRARTAFAPGKGISITSDGIINNTGAQSQYNLSINGTAGGNVLSTMSSVLTFPTVPTTDRYILRSLHVVNTSGSTAQISGNVLYATGNTAPIANLIPVAQGGVLEFIKTYQLFQPGDTINLQGFNSAGTATANLMTAMLTYETFTADQSFVGIGQTVANVDTNTLIYDSSQSYSIIESIKFINLQSSVVPIRTYWGDANGVPKAYLAYGLQVPPNSSIELLQGPKRINQNDRIYASYSGAPNAAVSVFVSARLGATYTIGPYVAAAPTGNSILAAFSTTDTEGTLLYYTIE
jgi:hypothetical protein